MYNLKIILNKLTLVYQKYVNQASVLHFSYLILFFDIIIKSDKINISTFILSLFSFSDSIFQNNLS